MRALLFGVCALLGGCATYYPAGYGYTGPVYAAPPVVYTQPPPVVVYRSYGWHHWR